MFRNKLQTSLKEIFDLKKVTFNAPGSYEQDTLFVDVTEVQSRISPGKRANAKVQGSLTVFSHGGRLPFGFFSKRVQGAEQDNTKDFFFFDLDVNALNSEARLQDISEIRGKFIFLYSEQFDPNQGEITDFEVEVGAPLTLEEDLIDVGDPDTEADGVNLDIGDGSLLKP